MDSLSQYERGLITGEESGKSIMQATGINPMAGFNLMLPSPQGERLEWLRGFAAGLVLAADNI